MKRLPEKTMMAAIILSCGFVMQSDPPEPPRQAKGAENARIKRASEPAKSSQHAAKEARTSTRRDASAPW